MILAIKPQNHQKIQQKIQEFQINSIMILKYLKKIIKSKKYKKNLVHQKNQKIKLNLNLKITLKIIKIEVEVGEVVLYVVTMMTQT
jgi:phosphopantothenoylcysteine synthetase/decarboxylase